MLKLAQERKLKGDKDKSERGDDSLIGTATSLAKGPDSGKNPSRDKRPTGDAPTGREEVAKKAKKDEVAHSLVIVPGADVRGRALVDLSTKGVPAGLEGGKESSLHVTTAKRTINRSARRIRGCRRLGKVHYPAFNCW